MGPSSGGSTMTDGRTGAVAAACVLIALSATAWAQAEPDTAPTTTTAPAGPLAELARKAPWLTGPAAMVGGVLSIIGGLIACFYGYRWHKAVFAALGFIIGSFVTGMTCAASAGGTAGVLAAFVGGFLGAALLFRFYLVAVFALGLTVGGSLLYAFMSSVAGPQNPVSMVVSILGAILCGVTAIRLHQMTVILATAYGGALFAGYGVLQFTSWALGAGEGGRGGLLVPILATVAALVVGTIGAGVQLSYLARTRRAKEARQDKSQ